MATKADKQIGMDEKVIDNQELLDMLEKRESLKQGAADYRAQDKLVKNKIKELNLDLSEHPVRIGRFVIKEAVREGRHVEFDIGAAASVKISTADE